MARRRERVRSRKVRDDQLLVDLDSVISKAESLYAKIQGMKRTTQMMMRAGRDSYHVQKAIRQALGGLQEASEGMEHVIYIAQEELEDLGY